MFNGYEGEYISIVKREAEQLLSGYGVGEACSVGYNSYSRTLLYISNKTSVAVHSWCEGIQDGCNHTLTSNECNDSFKLKGHAGFNVRIKAEC